MLDKTSTPSSSPLDDEPLAQRRPDDLTYVSDGEPGIRRKRAGKGYSFTLPDGSKLKAKDEIARIKALVIPPAWTDVWISPDPLGHIQATGRDQKGRKQYRYHARWSEFRDEAKYQSLVNFASALPRLRTQMESDLRRRGLPREKVLASIVWLLDNTMIRVGNPAYARDNKSFGLTTLRSRHVEVEGAKLRFAFKGKSGKEWNLKLVDRRMARILKDILDLPGQHLFQYRDEDGERRMVHSQDVNAYIRDATGEEFSSKHFRTWGGTTSATALFATVELPQTKREIAKVLNSLIDKVAARLGNTRAVCRSCYIHPRVVDSWSAGKLVEELAEARKRFRKPLDGLDEEEMLVLRWLSHELPA
ncbi:DNA topoisomerase IB [Aliihoeflea sp. PC F10.4]